MNGLSTRSKPPRHPWLEHLIAKPEQELRALIGRYALVHPYERAEPSDAAASLLAGLKPDDAAVLAFDKGCQSLIDDLRLTTSQAVKAIELDRIAAGANDLLTVMMRVRPITTIQDVHRRFVRWNSWVENLVIDEGLDIRREYYRLLALTQDIVTEPDHKAAGSRVTARRLLPFWLDICAGAGPAGLFDGTYLRVGLLGLRGLPLANLVDGNEVAVIEGLIRWASRQKPEIARFDHEWRLIAGAYPRDVEYWQALLNARRRTLPRSAGAPSQDMPEYWLQHVWNLVTPVGHGLASTTEIRALKNKYSGGSQRRAAPYRAVRFPSYAKLNQFIRDAKELPFAALRKDLQEFFADHKRCMVQTGVTEFFVRSSGMLGNVILKQGIGPLSDRAEFALALSSEIRKVEPQNAFGWSLWVSALVKFGRRDRAIQVGWETVRRFPEDFIAANHLATVLRNELGRADEAESLLRETVYRFPNDIKGIAGVRNNLANVLLEKSDGTEEAERLLRQTIEHYKHDQVNLLIARNQLATVLEKEGRLDEAEKLLTETTTLFSKSIRARNQHAWLLSSKLHRSKDAERVLREAIRLPLELPSDSERDIVVARNQLASILAYKLDQLADAQQLLIETISKYPNNAGATKDLEDLQLRFPNLVAIDNDALEHFLDEREAEFYKEVKAPWTQPLLDDPEKTLDITTEPKANAEIPASPQIQAPYHLHEADEHTEASGPQSDNSNSHPHAIKANIADIESIRITAQARRLMTMLHAISAHANPVVIALLQSEIQMLLAEDPNNPYVRLVATDAGIEQPREHEPIFALALHTAAFRHSLEELNSLKSRFTNAQQRALIDRTYNVVLNIVQVSDTNRDIRQDVGILIDQAASVLLMRVAV